MGDAKGTPLAMRSPPPGWGHFALPPFLQKANYWMIERPKLHRRYGYPGPRNVPRQNYCLRQVPRKMRKDGRGWRASRESVQERNEEEPPEAEQLSHTLLQVRLRPTVVRLGAPKGQQHHQRGWCRGACPCGELPPHVAATLCRCHHPWRV